MYKIDKRGNTYSFRYRDLDGLEKRYTCADDVQTLTEAKDEQITFTANLQQQKNIQKTGAADINLSWHVFCNLYRQFCSQNKKSVQRDNDTIKLIDRIIKIHYFREFTTVSIRNYIDVRLEEGRKKSSINRELICMKSMWSYAIRELKFPMDHQAQPVKKYKIPRILKDRVFSVDEINLILTENFVDLFFIVFSLMQYTEDKELIILFYVALKIRIVDERILTIFYLMLYVGMRLKDALLLKWHNVHFDWNIINFAPQKTDRIDPNEDYTPMRYRLRDFLLYLRQKNPNAEYVVNCSDTFRFSKSAASHTVIKILRSLGIQNASAHTCRHTFITLLFEIGTDSTDVMKWARINDINTVRVYKHNSIENEIQNINKLPY